MTGQMAQQISVAVLFVATVIQFILVIRQRMALRALKKELREEYWTKDVIGKTINAKTGKDPKAAEKLQEQILNGDVEEISCKDTKEFCQHIKDNVSNDPLPCSNPMTRQLGVSYVDGGQKFYVSIGLTVFKDGQDDLPIKFAPNLEASEFIQKLIDHYKGKEKMKGELSV